MNIQQHIMGCILGTAVGDAIGLPRERLSRRRAKRLYKDRPLQHALRGQRGMCSDDTEHTVMVAQDLARAGADPERITRDLARRLRWWLLRVSAGIGFGTLRACVKLWLEYGPSRSGVYSAGNGPAMPSALIVLVAPTADAMMDLVRASTRITHVDPRAEQGAAVIAATARFILLGPDECDRGTTLRDALLSYAVDEQLRTHLDAAFDAKEHGLTVEEFADQLGFQHGICRFVNHTIPVAVYCCMASRSSYRNSIEALFASVVMPIRWVRSLVLWSVRKWNPKESLTHGFGECSK